MLADARARATVGVPDEDPSVVIRRDVHEVVEVAFGRVRAIAGAGEVDAPALDGIARSEVLDGPARSPVVSDRDVQVPQPLEGRVLRITGGRAAEEGTAAA